MNVEQIVAKLEQIEEQAQRTLHEFPHGLARERLRLIIALAKQIALHMRSHRVPLAQAARSTPR